MTEPLTDAELDALQHLTLNGVLHDESGELIHRVVADLRATRAELAELTNLMPPWIDAWKADKARLAAVLALADAALVALSIDPADCNNSCMSGPCDCSGIGRPVAWRLNPADVRAAATGEAP